MVNERFYNKKRPEYKLSEIVEIVKCPVFPRLQYGNDIAIQDIKTMDEAKPGDLTFLTNKKYATKFKNTFAAACIVPEEFVEKINDKQIFLLVSKNPYFTYKQLIDLFYTRAKTYSTRIMPSAYVSSSAKIGKNCYIGHNVVIEDNCVIGDDCIIEAGSFIDYGVVIGSRAMIYSNVSISYSIIGDDAVILPGARIGQDGFGFATDAGVHHKILHTGLVRIGNNVEIGANSTIDRGSLTDTIIEDLCRIDNLVQVGHNVKIGRGSVIVAQAGIAGSSEVGKYCAIGGQAGIAGHLNIGDKAQVAAQAGVIGDIESGTIVGGYPSLPIRDWHKQSVILKNLIKKNS